MLAPLTSPNDCGQVLQYSGDIAGLGVRISFYIQILVLDFMVALHKDAKTSLWTLVLTSIGLTIAALVQLGMGQLTLLQGLLVSQLVCFATLATYLSLASYSTSKGKDGLLQCVAVIQGCACMILTILMWGLADKMVLSDCPDHPKFVFFFGVTLDALGRGRKAALGCSTILFFVYAILNVNDLYLWCQRRKKKSDPEDAQVRHIRQLRAKYNWYTYEGLALFWSVIIFQLALWIYFIVTTELILKRSHAKVSDSTVWGFGQVVAIILSLLGLKVLLEILWDKYKWVSREIKSEDINLKNLSH
ncbi:hypothetical protein M422DRAFT_24310 [Sphaerobolus stellatus SS14]|nr:hypothetical protein M422DRAFT_24310 [Sphaerobolus stellatus SS14]